MSATIVTTPSRWFVRGFFVGILISGSLNAVSFFFRSDGAGNLLGTAPDRYEALGFPCQVWESGNPYGGWFVDARGLLLNGLFAAAIGAACGLVAVRCRGWLNDLVARLEPLVRAREAAGWQFSLRGLLAATALAGLAAAGAHYALAGRPLALGIVYWLGPWFLVMLAFLPIGLSWQQRVVVLVPATFLLMAAAVAIGAALPQPLEFDRVLLYVFVCWTPQTVLVAIVLAAALVGYHTAGRG
jgi:hypothetical protein